MAEKLITAKLTAVTVTPTDGNVHSIVSKVSAVTVTPTSENAHAVISNVNAVALADIATADQTVLKMSKVQVTTVSRVDAVFMGFAEPKPPRNLLSNIVGTV